MERPAVTRLAADEIHIRDAIGAVHAGAADAGNTGWKAILELYHQLLRINSSPIVALN